MKFKKSDYIKHVKSLINAFLPIIIMLTLMFSMLLTSCLKAPEKTLTNIPAKPLYNKFDINETSLQSGNLYYNGFLTTDGTWIYFQSDDGTSLMKSSYSGDYPRLVSRHFPSFINVVGKTVFFIEGTNSGKIYKVDTDGKGETLVSDANAKYLIATQLYIFYIDTKDGYVYRTLHDGSKKTLLFNKVTAQIQSVDDVLYIFPANESTGIYKISMEAVKSFTTVALSPSPVSKSTTAASVSGASSAASVPGTSGTANTSILLVDIGLSPDEYESVNIQDNHCFYIDKTNNQTISVFDNKRHEDFLKTSLQSPFIISDGYIYFINQGDESRLYRVSSVKPSDKEMIINDRVNQFVVCGNSIYYRRENNLEIYRTPVDGGISYKIT